LLPYGFIKGRPGGGRLGFAPRKEGFNAFFKAA